MKPRLGMIFSLLLIGAVLNICIAWSLATFVPMKLCQSTARRTTMTATELLGSTSYADKLSSSEIRVTGFRHHAGVGVDGSVWLVRRESSVTDHESEVHHWYDPPIAVVAELRTGWPLRSMQGSFVMGLARWQDDPIEYQSSIPIPERLQPHDAFRFEFAGKRPLPLNPLWPGFIVNSITYTSVLFGVLFGARTIRHIRRRRTGRCAACGYLIGSSPVCTECGEPLPAEPIEHMVAGP